ncbi:MAG: DUF2617 family protein [Anaerolineae bacterium]|nr:DUF2617 family protein [Anaerolineae bacterium]
MKVAHQQPTDLVLGLIRTDFPLTVIQQARVEMGIWAFHFQIIGESHAVRIERSGQLLFTEVLACLDLPADSHLFHFADLTPYHYQTDSYTVSVIFESGSEMNLPPETSPNMIEVAFPQVYGQTPVTRITWQAAAEEMIWQTWHTYPTQNSGIWVKSFSRFKGDLSSGLGI